MHPSRVAFSQPELISAKCNATFRKEHVLTPFQIPRALEICSSNPGRTVFDLANITQSPHSILTGTRHTIWKPSRKILVTTKRLHGRNEDGLLIVCYGGHGEIDKSTQHSIWKAWKFPPRRDSPAVSPRVDWSELQEGLMKSKGDLLFILDCCYAAGALQKSPQGNGGRRNFLLASGNDKASNTNTLTKAILYELEDLAGQPSPIHIGEKRIVLAPLPDPTVSTSSDSQQLVQTDEAMLRKNSQCRVLVSVTLTEIGTQSARDAWVEWIRDNAPPNIAAFE
ncbi:hypothetical protein Q7P36_007777 [Cladosporium allicinum]